MKRILLNGLLLVAFTMTGLPFTCADDEEEIPLKEVPQKVLDVANAKLKGIVFTEAEVEKKGDNTVYELEGKLNGIEYEIEITLDKNGKIIVTVQG